VRGALVALVAGVSLVLTTEAGAASSPTVSTGRASSLTTSAATLNGTVNPEGLSTRYSFQYGTTASYGAQTAIRSAGSGTRSVAVSARVTGLISGTVYHFRLVATNARGTAVGVDRTFRTAGQPPPPPPGVVTGNAVSRTLDAATLTGLVDPRGNPTTYSFQFGTSTAYGLQTAPATLPGAQGASAVSFRLGGLAAHRIYHYRLVASNRGGTTVGADALFITGRVRPRAVTASTVPRRLRHRPYRVTTRGRLVIPTGFPPPDSCRGPVTIRYRLLGRTVATVHAGLSPQCTFAASARLHTLTRAAHVRVYVLFGGNSLLLPHRARVQTITIAA
jgi:hypothetical protein